MDFVFHYLMAHLDTLPYLHIQYLTMGKKMRLSKVALYITASCVFVLLSLGYAFLATNQIISPRALVWYREGQMVVFYVLPFLLTRENAFKILFFDGLIYPFSTVITTSSLFIEQAIDSGFIDFYHFVTVRFFLSAIILVSTYYIWKKFSKEAAAIGDKFFWAHIFHLPLILSIITRIFLPTSIESKGITVWHFVGSVMICLLGFAITYVSFVIARYETNKVVMKEREQKVTLLLELQDQQYEQLAEQIERSRRERHDMRHHLATIRQFAENDDADSAKEYIRDVMNEYSKVTNVKICENYTANAILSHYIEKAREHKIPIKVQFVLEKDSKIQDLDLCVLIGNAIENAIEACLDANENQRFINIRTTSKAGRLYIVFQNGYQNEPKMKNGEFLSAKRDYKRSGVGISSIRAIAVKYGGEIKIETDNNVFKLAVMIPEQE